MLLVFVTVLLPAGLVWILIDVLNAKADAGQISNLEAICGMIAIMVVFGLYVWFLFPVVGPPALDRR